MVLWTIYVRDTYGSFHFIEIDNNETFGNLRRKAAEVVKIPIKDLLLVGKIEYSREFDSKKLSEIEGLDDGSTLAAVFPVGDCHHIK